METRELLISIVNDKLGELIDEGVDPECIGSFLENIKYVSVILGENISKLSKRLGPCDCHIGIKSFEYKKIFDWFLGGYYLYIIPFEIIYSFSESECNYHNRDKLVEIFKHCVERGVLSCDKNRDNTIRSIITLQKYLPLEKILPIVMKCIFDGSQDNRTNISKQIIDLLKNNPNISYLFRDLYNAGLRYHKDLLRNAKLHINFITCKDYYSTEYLIRDLKLDIETFKDEIEKGLYEEFLKFHFQFMGYKSARF